MANVRRDARVATWKNIGTDVAGCTTAQDVLVRAGLDYTVVKRPVYDRFGGRYRRSNEWFFTERESDGFRYGIVKKGYEIVQNLNAFSFVDFIPDFSYVKAGETECGMVYIIGSLPPVDILGDKFTPYVVFVNGFSGNSSVKIVLSPLRVICANQIPFIMKEAENAVSFRHTKSAPMRVKQAGDASIAMAAGMARLNKMAEGYAAMKVSPRQVGLVLDAMFPVNANASEAAARRIEEKKQRFIDAYDEADNHAFRGTAWGLINAYTDCLTRKDLKGSATEETRFVNVTLRKPEVFNVTANKFIDIVNDIAVA